MKQTLREEAGESLRIAGLTKPGIDAHVHLWSAGRLPVVVQQTADDRPDLREGVSAEALIEQAKEHGLGHVILVRRTEAVVDGVAVPLSAVACSESLQKTFHACAPLRPRKNAPGMLSGTTLT